MSVPSRRPPPHAWPVLAAVAFVLGCVACRYDSATGFTSLLRFGSKFAARRLPEIRMEPVRTYPGDGYDGQFYAQLAVAPDPVHPDVQAALDNPRYRARRILLPAVVHVAGAGHPWLTLQLYALGNVAAWLAVGWLLWRRTRALGWHGTGIWLACMLGLGALDSVRLSLTDLPALLLVLIGLEAVERGRDWPALGALAAATLTRDTALLAAAAPARGDLRSARAWVGLAGRAFLIALPFGLWSCWLSRHVPAGDTLGNAPFTWPFLGLAHQVAACTRAIASGSLDSRYTFGLLAAGSFTFQAVFVLSRLQADSPPVVRMAAPFALVFFLLGEPVWQGYWAVARTCLPLTFAFNLLLPRDRRFWPFLLAGNVCVLHAVYRFLPD